jgi:hypothetical protein
MTNKAIAQNIFNILEAKGFKAYNIQYGNTYFLFTGEDDSIVHFRMKGVSKHWKFGMWINAENISEKIDWEDDKPIVQFFAQYDTQIDKFKPSRSALCVEYDNSDYQDMLTPNGLWQIVQMLQFMRKHFFLAYNEFCGEHAGYTGSSFIRTYLKYEGREKWKTIKELWCKCLYLPWTKLKIALCKNDKVVHSIRLEDFEKEHPGWSTGYKYSVKIKFTEDASDEDMCKFVNKWFKKQSYGKFATYHYMVDVDVFAQVGREGYFTLEEENK